MPLLKQGGKKDCDKLIVAMALLKQGGKKNVTTYLWQCHCRNRGIKKKYLAIVAMALPKMGKKNDSEIWGRVKKTINHM